MWIRIQDFCNEAPEQKFPCLRCGEFFEVSEVPKVRMGRGGHMGRYFEYAEKEKRYHTYDYYLKKAFGCKCAKIGLDGGFTCPNKDGTKGTGGCFFCGGGGGETTAPACEPLRLQYEKGRARLEKKWGRLPTIPYFQANTSTYAPVSRLRALFEEALSFKDVRGLTIATRPDALPPQVLSYLSELNERTRLTVELGLQSVFERTARRINRGHTYEEFLQGYEALKSRGIRVCVHLIDGLPGETPEMMLESARVLGKLGPDGVKFHQLYVRKGTGAEEAYRRGELPLLSLAEYLEILACQICLLPPKTVVERISGDPERSELCAPPWCTDKKKILGGLDQYLEKRGLVQGIWHNCTKISPGFLDFEQQKF